MMQRPMVHLTYRRLCRGRQLIIRDDIYGFDATHQRHHAQRRASVAAVVPPQDPSATPPSQPTNILAGRAARAQTRSRSSEAVPLSAF